MREIDRKEIEIEKLIPHPDLKRELNDKSAINMVQSAKERIEQDVIVRPKGDYFEILDGHLRVQSLRENGFTKVMCSIRECSDLEALFLGFKLNVVRQDMEPMHMVRVLKASMIEYYKEHPNAQRWGGNKTEQTEDSFTSFVCKTTGISPFVIRQLIRLDDNLDEETKQMVASGKKISENKIPIEMADVLTRVDDNDVRKKIRDTALEKSLTTPEVSELVMEWKNGDDIDNIINIEDWKRHYIKTKYLIGDLLKSLDSDLFGSMPIIKKEDMARYFDKLEMKMEKARGKLGLV